MTKEKPPESKAEPKAQEQEPGPSTVQGVASLIARMADAAMASPRSSPKPEQTSAASALIALVEAKAGGRPQILSALNKVRAAFGIPLKEESDDREATDSTAPTQRAANRSSKASDGKSLAAPPDEPGPTKAKRKA